MTHKTQIAELRKEMRDLANRIVECEGENSEGEDIISLYDWSDETFKAQNIILILDQLEAAEARTAKVEAHAEQVNGWYVKMKTRMLAAEAEVAAMRGGRDAI